MESSKKTKSETLNEKAWDLKNQGRLDEALTVINHAIALDNNDSNNWNVKAIILEGQFRYEEAIECYDQALKINPTSKTIKNRKACSLSQLAEKQKYTDHDWQKGLNLINEALKLLSDDQNKKSYLRIKEDMLRNLGKPIEADICFFLSYGDVKQVERINRQTEILRNSCGTLINITGTRYYKFFEPFSKNAIVNLIKEPENEHDSDAIRVEKDGETVGYVANSDYSLIPEVKSASQIKNALKENQKAKVMFVYYNGFVIAKLL